MAKIANALGVPASSSTQSITLGNNNNFLGTNTLDCKGSAAFGTFAGTAAPTNAVIASGFFGGGTATQFLSGSTAEFVMPATSTECDILQTSYVGSIAANASNMIHLTARGTQASPTANLSGDALGIWGARGYTGSAFSTTSKASITMLTTQTWTAANNGTAIAFSITTNNTTTLTEIARILNTSTSISGIAISDLGSGLLIKEGANARMGRAVLIPVLLSPSVVVVSNNTVTANTEIFLTSNVPSGGPGILSITARTPGVSFTISSSSIGDTSTVSWLLIEPSP